MTLPCKHESLSGVEHAKLMFVPGAENGAE